MSNVFYPLSGFEDLPVMLMENSVQDAFEDGSTASRLLWSPQNFKRRFTLKHMQLTQAEFAWLRRFFSARSGRYDSFWFRDNVNRGGNALVRLSDKFAFNRKGLLYTVQTTLDEVAPIRLLPDVDDITAILPNQTFQAWYDANRQIALSHMGLRYYSAAIYDSTLNQDLTVLALTDGNWVGFTSQYSYWILNQNDVPHKTAGNALDTPGSQTIFTIVATPGGEPNPTVITFAGSLGTGKGIGIILNGASYYPYIGGAEVWTGAAIADSNFHSVAVTFSNTAGTVTAKLYLDGALTNAGANPQNYTAGPLCVGAAPDGSMASFYSGAAPRLGHCLYSSGVASQAQIKAFHNLLAYQYGMPTV